MILLRPTINLYYDKIVDENIPIPNGLNDYQFSRDRYRLPYSKNKELPINHVTMLYNSMKVLGVENINLFSGNETSKNLFYPLELSKDTWDQDLEKFIPKKTIKKIVNGKMKLLIFAPRLAHHYVLMLRLKFRLDNLSKVGIQKEMIHIVLGDLNRTYRRLFDNNNVYGIDWWQIYAQISYKSRYEMKNWHWVFREPPSLLIIDKQNLENENFQFENWKPKRIFTAFTGNMATHNIAFISEMLQRGLERYGKYSFNLEDKIKILDNFHQNIKITDKSRGLEYIESKKAVLESMKNLRKTLDFPFSKISSDPLVVDKSVYEDSLISIVSDSFSPPFDKTYLDEIDSISPKLGVWRQIAKGHPFIHLGCLNTMGYLGNEGYFLPTSIVNHRYDRISNTPKKVAEICNIIENLSNLSHKEIEDKVQELIPYMKKNKEKFFDKPNRRKFEQLFREMAYE